MGLFDVVVNTYIRIAIHFTITRCREIFSTTMNPVGRAAIPREPGTTYFDDRKLTWA